MVPSIGGCSLAAALTVLAVLGTGCGGCGDASHRLLVDLRTDLRPRFDFDAARTRVVRGGSGADTVRGLLPGDDYLAGVRVAEITDVDEGLTTVELSLLDSEGAVVAMRRATFEVRGDRAVTIVMTSDCVDRVCPGTGDPERASECLSGHCVPPECVRPGDPECAGFLPECVSAAECGEPVACARPSCIDATCLTVPDDSRCSAGEYCDVREGCTRAAAGDAGMPDAGPVDSGAPPCTPAGCDDGDPCTDDTCAVGAGCEHAFNAGPCDDGVLCNGSDTCAAGTCTVHSGDPCVGDTVCDESAGGCVGCVGDTDCPAPIIGAWTTCAGFADVCDETGEQSRMVTDFTCLSSVCMPDTRTEMRACTRPSTDGASCGSRTCGAWGACSGFSGGCDPSGTESRTCTDRVCAGGTCGDSPATEMRSCTRPVCAPGSTRPCGTDRVETCSDECTWCNCMLDEGTPHCGGTTGTWSGCRGTGCDVCADRVSAYPCYFSNHPSCRPNSACGGSYYPCNAKCPAPTAADACTCSSTGGGWAGCGGSGCEVCSTGVAGYACYFLNHPGCRLRATCSGAALQCNALCPAPTDADVGSAM